MTDDETEPTDDEQLDDVDAALESAGFVDEPDDDEPDDDGNPSPKDLIGKLGSLSGTGKPLDSYAQDPVASVFTPDGYDEPPKGALHIARGVDGISPFTAAHPLIDIAVGFVLLRAETRMRGGDGGDPNDPTDPPGKLYDDDDLS